MRRKHWQFWAALIALAIVGVTLAGAAAIIRQRWHRGDTALAAEASTIVKEPTSIPTTAAALPRPSPPQTNPTKLEPVRKRVPTVVVDSIKYRLMPLSPADLAEQLALVEEYGIERTADDPLVQSLIRSAREHGDQPLQYHPMALALKDVHSLPLRLGHACRLPHYEAVTLQSSSRQIREQLAKESGGAETLRSWFDGQDRRTWESSKVVPTLVQMLQADQQNFRMLLVQQLSRIEGKEASRALARRAIFDVEIGIRHEALKAMKRRPHSEYRDVLLDGLRHPWPEAADFAATALVAVRDRKAALSLLQMLDAPGPNAAFAVKENGSTTYHIREMVRVNHLRNCIVCHAVSFDETNLVRASTPDPNAALPPAFTPAYYRPDSGRLFVRADVTYLQQDFSLPQRVANHGLWPEQQRYDYCVRTRQLSADEWEEHRERPAANPQRESILFALRELTETDADDTSPAWLQAIQRMH